jgi:hypothetical protein
MSFFSYALGALILILVVLRQLRVRPVPRVFRAVFPFVLGVIGLFGIVSYTGDHYVSSSAWAWVVGTLVVGALGFGALRGLSMRVWADRGWVLRQGTNVTLALWLASLAVHIVGDTAGDHAGAAGLEGSSFLLYLGVTLAVQYYVIHRRAQPLWEQLGPDAGRPLQFTMTETPGGIFTIFRAGGPAAGPSGWGPPMGDPQHPYHDPNIIDAEVVEDDEHEPPQLPPAR